MLPLCSLNLVLCLHLAINLLLLFNNISKDFQDQINIRNNKNNNNNNNNNGSRTYSRPGSDGNKGVLRIPQSYTIAGTSPSDCLVSYPRLSLGWGAYSTAPADWAKILVKHSNSLPLSTPLSPSLLGPLWPRMETHDRVLSMSQIELNCMLMLNWIVLNRTVLTFKLRASKWLMLNWIVGNPTV